VGADALTSISLSAAVTGDVFDVTFAPASVPANHTMYVESTSMLSPGINNANSRFRFIDTAAAAAASPQDFFAGQTTKFGPLVAGQKAFVRAKFINKNTGEVSLPLVASAIVGA
jgi:hypothetical protein